MEQRDKQKEITRLTFSVFFISLSCGLLVYAFVYLTEHLESGLSKIAHTYWPLQLIFPFIGLSLIFFLRQYLFKKRENKGIKEIYDSLKTRHNELKFYKIPSHLINGLLTIGFGGSTGIEVSTVVASASVGAVTHKEQKIHPLFRRELIAAGVAAGVTALFGSPLAGMLFAFEVILKKVTQLSFVLVLGAVLLVWGLDFVLNTKPLFTLQVDHWNYSALPWFLLLGAFSALNSVYLTKSVLFFKERFARVRHGRRIIFCSLAISCCILTFPALYGDGYHYLRELLADEGSLVFSLTLLTALGGVLVLKPLVCSLTLAGGGDGGVFGPSLFTGAFAGLFTALILQRVFGAELIPLNFMLVGMAAVLSACLHAPLTAIFVVCGITGNYTLLIPLAAASLVSKIIAQQIVPYTVYSYSSYKSGP
ncbi:MAG: chloride channel protein [Crocinitomicaceae bacterium]|jgi:CIC family chloride channel protein|nr:chloride channel protein [Crocinitomicaceae bacterium]